MHNFSHNIDGKRHIWLIHNLHSYCKSFPVQQIDITLLQNNLELNLWFDESEEPTINAILIHIKRIQNADTNYPIIVGPNYVIMDGLHRLVKAILAEETTIPAICLKNWPMADIINCTQPNVSQNKTLKVTDKRINCTQNMEQTT